MELTIKSRNSKITERQRSHINEKLSKLVRYMGGITSATVEVHTQQQRNAGEVSRVQVTLVGEHGVILRAEEQSNDLFSAIDQVQSVLQRQIKRYKEKYWRRERAPRPVEAFVVNEPDLPTAEAAPDEEADHDHELIRTKQFTLRPMFTDDAIEQMELLGHNFFIFQDAENQRLSVLYRRRDGNYGLIVPDPV
ncbi:ribosome hibernation-promoting factor, HPF/YfiA family [Candidatus Viridilinea mediisalina]|uniref:Ribosome hibernation promoting factor n=1 Tax=Candidatus Viridilinea mediisalina TaxID=2024553 RepID=A0A2A6RP18_9CHLR|nr:ribosome-associated translation inhibitor RaiA [Candidatus Viridilinea mediisalina]PDW04580.1 ribosomal subunit interface protein [Candidatus Viridilinea mediisalina]